MVEMVRQVGALQVGKFFRERMLTGHYAEQLLDKYMFRAALDGHDRRNSVINNFLRRAPSHEFHLDYHMCLAWGLDVAEMTTGESDLAKGVTTTLNELVDARIICPNISGHRRLPFFKLYPYTVAPETIIPEAAAPGAGALAPEEQ
jgi:hypothetical protein